MPVWEWPELVEPAIIEPVTEVAFVPGQVVTVYVPTYLGYPDPEDIPQTILDKLTQFYAEWSAWLDNIADNVGVV